jgi:hypothetical protein
MLASSNVLPFSRAAVPSVLDNVEPPRELRRNTRSGTNWAIPVLSVVRQSIAISRVRAVGMDCNRKQSSSGATTGTHNEHCSPSVCRVEPSCRSTQHSTYCTSFRSPMSRTIERSTPAIAGECGRRTRCGTVRRVRSATPDTRPTDLGW